MRKTSPHPQATMVVTPRPFRAKLTHNVLQSRGHSDFRDTRTNELHDIFKSLIADFNGLADAGKLLGILDLPQGIQR